MQTVGNDQLSLGNKDVSVDTARRQDWMVTGVCMYGDRK